MVLSDTHVHIDFFSDPIEVANSYESKQIYAIFVTYLPEVFKKHIVKFNNYKYIRLAIGFHPDMVGEYSFNEKQFSNLIDETRYIGEVGLDFSKGSKKHHQEQIEVFNTITLPKYNKGRIYTIHSRGAEEQVLDILRKNNVNQAIFHWYSGDISTLKRIIDNGYYFSVNYKMIDSVKGRELIKRIPSDKLLFETDAPFAKMKKKIVYPGDIPDIYKLIGEYVTNFEKISSENFKRILVEKDLDKFRNQIRLIK